MGRVELIAAHTLDSAVQWVADLLFRQYQDALSEADCYTISLAGGGTPRNLYALLASPLWRAKFDWERIGIFVGDERHVPQTDPRSNFRMIRETLLDRVLVPQRNLHPIRTTDDIESDAKLYAKVLEQSLPTASRFVRFDTVLLGLGPDGHTASLFPGSTALHETERSVVDVVPPNAPTPRITITPPVINNARNVIVLTAGHLKAGALARLLAMDGTVDDIPARAIDPIDGKFYIVCDLPTCERLDELPLRDGIVTRRL